MWVKRESKCEEHRADAPKTSATEVEIVSRSETEIDRLIEPLWLLLFPIIPHCCSCFLTRCSEISQELMDGKKPHLKINDVGLFVGDAAHKSHLHRLQ